MPKQPVDRNPTPLVEKLASLCYEHQTFWARAHASRVRCSHTNVVMFSPRVCCRIFLRKPSTESTWRWTRRTSSCIGATWSRGTSPQSLLLLVLPSGAYIISKCSAVCVPYITAVFKSTLFFRFGYEHNYNWLSIVNSYLSACITLHSQSPSCFSHILNPVWVVLK